MKKILYYIAVLLVPAMPLMQHAVPANSVIATINVGVTPTAVAFSPDGKTAYVVNNNNYGDPGSDNITVVDVATNLPIATINDASFSEPWRIAINAAGTKAYVCNSNTTTVSIVDLATNTVTSVIPGFDGPSGIVITPDGRYAYVNNYGIVMGGGNGNTVSVVDLSIDTIVDTIVLGPVNTAPAALAITPDGAYVYVVNYESGNPGTGTVSKIQTSDNSVTTPISGLSGPFGIVITPNGKYAYVSNFGSNNFYPFGSTVSVIDLTTDTIIKTISVGIQPAGIAITPDGRYVYVSNYNTLYASGPTPPFNSLTPGQGTVNIIDTATNTVIPPTIEVNQSPNGIGISPNGFYAYVTNFISNTVNVIAVQTFQLAATGCKTRNIFLTHEDLVNKLTITATGSYLPIEYSVYRDAGLTDLVGTAPATTNPFVFYDYNRDPNVANTYYVVGTNVVGTTSAPVVVRALQNC